MRVTRVRISSTSRGFQVFADYRLDTGKRQRRYVGQFDSRPKLVAAIERIAAADAASISSAGSGGV